MQEKDDRLVLGLTSYFDDSGSDDGSPVVTCGGPVYPAGLLKIHRVGWAIGAEHAMWQSWLRLEYDRVVSNEPTTLPIVLLGILLVLLVVVWGYFFYHLGGGG